MHRYASSSRSMRLGSGQTDDYCPSRMNVVYYDNRLMVVYFRKHSHDVAAGPEYWVDLKNLPLNAANSGGGLANENMGASQPGSSGAGGAVIAAKRSMGQLSSNAGDAGDHSASKVWRSWWVFSLLFAFTFSFTSFGNLFSYAGYLFFSLRAKQNYVASFSFFLG